MHAIATPTTTSIAFGTPRAGRPWWARLTRGLAVEYRARRAMRELAGLDEHLLRDIGLGRGGIERAARFGRG